MFREIAMAQYMSSMATGVGLTVDMGKDGRSKMDIGNNWTEHERPDGKKFYTNSTTGKRTWSRPTEEGVLPETAFEKCNPYVNKMKYDGKFPSGMETQANDGYDCNSFLDRLYDMNEKQWEKESVLKSSADRKIFDATGMPIQQPAGMQLNAQGKVQLPSEEQYVPKPASA